LIRRENASASGSPHEINEVDIADKEIARAVCSHSKVFEGGCVGDREIDASFDEPLANGTLARQPPRTRAKERNWG
jgi:hypothetical protein